MADDAAHIPARPTRQSKDGEGTDAVTHDARTYGSDDLIATPERGDPPPDDHTSGGGNGVEVIGWQTASSATVRKRELVAVGSGEGEGSPAPDFSDPQPEPSPWSDPRSDVVDDAPQWSFPGEASVLPPPAAPADDKQSELPFAAAVAPALAPPRPMPRFGPVGRTRTPLLVPVVSVLTLGVYALVWHHNINRELEEFDPKLHSRPRRSMVAVLLPWLAGLLVTMAGAALIITSRLHVQLPFDPHVTTSQAYYLLGGLVAVPYLTLLLPFSLVAVVMTLERLRSVEEHIGATTDRQVHPVGTSLLLAIPVVGGLALLTLEQRRLNAIWQAVTPSGHLKS